MTQHGVERSIRSAQAPRIWLVTGEKPGDNAQAEIVGSALGLPFERRVLRFHPQYQHGKPRFRASLYHVDLQRSDPLVAPWPDLIVTIGRRPSMAALWVRAQSGGRTKLVIIGRPRRFADRFDLILSPCQYRVPSLPNLMRLELPLLRPDPAALDRARVSWADRLQALPRPLIAVLIGGPTRPHRFDASVAASLLRRCESLRQRTGGTLYLSTSRRTPAEVVAELQTRLPAGALLYRWGDPDSENPYLGLLALADLFVVTGDSISMMVEVVRNRGSLAIYSLPKYALGRFWQRLTALLFPLRSDTRGLMVTAWLGRLLYRTGLMGYPRDLSLVERFLVDNGYAVELGDEPTRPGRGPPDSLAEVVERIRGLLESA